MSTKDSEDASTLDKAAADLILPAKNAEDEIPQNQLRKERW
jgi:hypothetical protein